METSPDNGKADRQERFVQLLREHSEKRKAEWAQSASEPGFVHCLVAEEYLMFQLLGAGGELVRPHQDAIVGITCHFGNVTYLWVPGSRDWDTVLDLLRQSPIDDGKVDRFRKVAQNLQNRVLERMIERET